ncbi:hypothetical protein WN944_003512 [Citrus x changshan-huyou]|uniref:Uncharacterized protein n=1 Tax=Citrus x changshan-huyou TaxID=2935761 RepID=A0AAP0M4W5_9ROSI
MCRPASLSSRAGFVELEFSVELGLVVPLVALFNSTSLFIVSSRRCNLSLIPTSICSILSCKLPRSASIRSMRSLLVVIDSLALIPKDRSQSKLANQPQEFSAYGEKTKTKIN